MTGKEIFTVLLLLVTIARCSAKRDSVNRILSVRPSVCDVSVSATFDACNAIITVRLVYWRDEGDIVTD